MGIDARRNINVSDSNDDTHYDIEVSDKKDSNNLSDEILKLEELKKKGILTDEEYEKAKKKFFNVFSPTKSSFFFVRISLHVFTCILCQFLQG